MALYFEVLPNDLKGELLYHVYDDYGYEDFEKDETDKINELHRASLIVKNSPTLWKNKYENEISRQIPLNVFDDNDNRKPSYKNAYESVLALLNNIKYGDYFIDFSTIFSSKVWVGKNCRELD